MDKLDENENFRRGQDAFLATADESQILTYFSESAFMDWLAETKVTSLSNRWMGFNGRNFLYG